MRAVAFAVSQMNLEFFITKLTETPRIYFSIAYSQRWHQEPKSLVQLLPWLAVLDREEDFLEPLDTVQVGQKQGNLF